MLRRAEFRPFSWINDLSKRGQLELDPPYQRRSVWSQRYKVDFVTTVLLGYPCPAIFLYEEIRPDGTFSYKVVDGKQRLTTLISFAADEIAIADDYPSERLKGRVFSDLTDEDKLAVWRYSFAVEIIQQENETIINDIFNRINNNVARLSPQELRHARMSGVFIQACESLSEGLARQLPDGFPRIAPQSRRQMKDVENVATLLLFCEQGERSLSQADLDQAFSIRDDEWIDEAATIAKFNSAIAYIADLCSGDDPNAIVSSRLRNQADIYSLFGAIVELFGTNMLPPIENGRSHITDWLGELARAEDQGAREGPEAGYLRAARSASNDPTPRRTRIDRVKAVLRGAS